MSADRRIISPRQRALLEATAAELREGMAPLGEAFLVAHDVTLDEAYALAEWLAVGVDVLTEMDATGPGRNMIAVSIGAAAAART